jgi:hypothetical protein
MISRLFINSELLVFVSEAYLCQMVWNNRSLYICLFRKKKERSLFLLLSKDQCYYTSASMDG